MQNLWAAQAQARAKISPKEVDARAVPRVLMADDEVALDGAGDAFERAKCFWNVWDRQGWTSQGRKVRKVTSGCDPKLISRPKSRCISTRTTWHPSCR